MEIKSKDNRDYYAIDFKHKSFNDYVGDSPRKSYLKDVRLHKFCEKIGLTSMPLLVIQKDDPKRVDRLKYE